MAISNPVLELALNLKMKKAIEGDTRYNISTLFDFSKRISYNSYSIGELIITKNSQPVEIFVQSDFFMVVSKFNEVTQETLPFYIKEGIDGADYYTRVFTYSGDRKTFSVGNPNDQDITIQYIILDSTETDTGIFYPETNPGSGS